MIRRFASLALVLSLCAGVMLVNGAWLPFDNRAFAHPAAKNGNADAGDSPAAKISPSLRKELRGTGGRKKDASRVEIILQLKSKPGERLNALLKSEGVEVGATFDSFNARAVKLPSAVVEELANLDEVSYLSADAEVATLGHVSATTGADAVREPSATDSTRTTTLDGTGIGIAVIDSGIDKNHLSLLGFKSSGRVVASADFTGEGRTDDPYGHGTHVAAIAAGNNRIAAGKYVGIAPNSNLVNLRVLDSRGKGTVSALLSALNWVMARRSLYNIRVVNMSLGTPAIDTYTKDPVCLAVRRLVDAGVVVVAAAGNSGKDASNNKIYGRIHAPGNELSAITVGASNSLGTDERSDDIMASYSSRGPTRSYRTDAAGTKHYDNLIKPDIVAPGNKIVSASSHNNYLVRANPLLDAKVSSIPSRRMMYMNGTSMSSPVVAGAAALLLQANPRLTPNMVKVLLMYTSQQLPGVNTLEQGAGEINIAGAVGLARLVRTDLSSSTPIGAPLLTVATPPAPQSVIAGQTFTWSQGVIMDRTFATGSSLITNYQRVYDTGVLLSDGVVLADGIMRCDPQLLSTGVTLSENLFTGNGITISEGINFLGTNALMGDGVMISDGMLLSDGIVTSDGVMVADGVMIADSMLAALSAMINGDGTRGMTADADDASGSSALK